jgi:threonine dehydrogenase-like Zn-dependent dehydrogenase
MLAAMKSDPTRYAARLIPGHEFCAEVLDYGPSTGGAIRKRWPVGALVCANPFVGNDMELVGQSPRYPGGLGELMVLDVHRLVRVPEGVSAEHAALTEPLAVGIRAVTAGSSRTSEGPYVVIGCGPIGLAVILALRVAGLGPIIASDMAPERRALAGLLGADEVVAADTTSPFDRLHKFGFTEFPASPMLDTTAGALGPLIFECVGRHGILRSIIESAPRHSHIVVVGVCAHPDTIVPGLAVGKELSADFVLAYRPSEFAESLRRISEHAIDPTPLITATVGLDDAPWAIEALRRGEHTKILVLPGAAPSAEGVR